jgi:hypothetical protein
VHEPPARDHDHVVDTGLHLAEHVAGDQDGTAAIVREMSQEAAQPDDPLGIEAVGRLVEHEHTGIPQQGRRESEALPHARREATDPPLGRLGEPDLGQHLLAAAVVDAGEGGEHAQVVTRGAARVEPGGVERGADDGRRAAQLRVPVPLDQRGARVGGREPEQHPERRRLPGAVRPEEPRDGAGPHHQVQAVDGPDVAEPLGQPADRDRCDSARCATGHAHGPSRLPVGRPRATTRSR